MSNAIAPGGATGSETALPLRWLDWAERHPGLFLLGAVMVAVLLLAREPGRSGSEYDPVGDEVPLFI